MRSVGQSRSHLSVVLLLAVVLVACLAVAAAVGSVRVPFGDVLKICWNAVSPFNFDATWRPADETIILHVRLPRVVGGALVGAGLATAGVIFQGLLRNPMADPYIIGTSAGAALGATIAMVLPLSMTFLGFGMVPLLAFAGALATVFLVYRLARVGGRTPVVSMLLAGFVVSAMLSALMYLIITMSDRLYEKFQSVYAFLLGGISVGGWGEMAVIAPIIILGVLAGAAAGLSPERFRPRRGRGGPRGRRRGTEQDGVPGPGVGVDGGGGVHRGSHRVRRAGGAPCPQIGPGTRTTGG